MAATAWTSTAIRCCSTDVYCEKYCCQMTRPLPINTRIRIDIDQNTVSTLLEIEDDGIGFDPQIAVRRGCLGLANMQERAQAQGWQMQIASRPGEGTRIRVEVPAT